MTIRVLFFASLAARVGREEMSLQVSDKATVAEAVARLGELYPDVAALGDRLATAVDLAYVKGSHPLHEGAELALIPPVSGG